MVKPRSNPEGRKSQGDLTTAKEVKSLPKVFRSKKMEPQRTPAKSRGSEFQGSARANQINACAWRELFVCE